MTRAIQSIRLPLKGICMVPKSMATCGAMLLGVAIIVLLGCQKAIERPSQIGQSRRSVSNQAEVEQPTIVPLTVGVVTSQFYPSEDWVGDTVSQVVREVSKASGYEFNQRNDGVELLYDVRYGYSTHEGPLTYELFVSVYFWDVRQGALIGLWSTFWSQPSDASTAAHELTEELSALYSIRFTRGDSRLETSAEKYVLKWQAAHRPIGQPAKRVVVDFGPNRDTELDVGDSSVEQTIYELLDNAGWDIGRPGYAADAVITVRWERVKRDGTYFGGPYPERAYKLSSEILASRWGETANPAFSQIVAVDSPNFVRGLVKPATVSVWRERLKSDRALERLLEALETIPTTNRAASTNDNGR